MNTGREIETFAQIQLFAIDLPNRHSHNPSDLDSSVALLGRYFGKCVALLLLSSLGSLACQRAAPPPPPQQQQPPATNETPTTASRQEPAAPSVAMSNKQQSESAPKKPVSKTPKRPAQDSGAPATRSFAIYTLSRGSGVPTEARAAQLEIQKLVEADRDKGLTVSIETTRIGIEGERRLCVTYKDARNSARAFERARAIVKGVSLINLVAEPCTPPSSSPEKKKEII